MSDPASGHGRTSDLDEGARAVLKSGLGELLGMTEGLAFRPLVSERHPLPLALAVCGRVPEPAEVREAVSSRMADDPVDALLPALVLLELVACNEDGMAERILDDPAFLGAAFNSKRMNGWLAVTGDCDRKAILAAVKARWKFKPMEGPGRRTALYPLLNALVRCGFVYGRITPGESHEMCHFIEDFGQGVVVVAGKPDDLELALSLAAMRLGVPAVVPPDYPFPLGRRIAADSPARTADAVTGFPTVRKLLDFPGIPPLPEWMDWGCTRENVVAAATWGDTPGSFLVLRKGKVDRSGVEVTGTPAGPLGVVLTVDAEPLDAFDRDYLEGEAAESLSWIRGVKAEHSAGRVVVSIAAGAKLTPEMVGEALVAGLRHRFPRIGNVRAEVILDPAKLAEIAPGVRTEIEARGREMAGATEETIPRIVTCTGCSPFAPDHVCIVTHESPPQCGRPYGMIKTGALYGLDDMSDIHHRSLHFGMNSFGTCEKGDLLDPVAGEWSGVNAAAARLTGGRTTRIQLHRLDVAPRTGCGCFGFIIFSMDGPVKGIGIMERGWDGRTPDGRTWWDLHYALGGKQAPGLMGASAGYLVSRRFLAAHGGWKGVTWVSPRVAGIAGDRLPPGARVGGASGRPL